MGNISNWSVFDGFRLARTVGKNLRNRSNYTTSEFISAAEKALKRHPNEWVIYFALGDKYQSVGKYADSLVVLRRCVELKPFDIRSTYALATAYNLITRAAWSQEEVNLFNKLVASSEYQKIDLAAIEVEMKRAGLTIQAAATQAVRWFKKSLSLDPDNRSKKQIQEDLQTLYERFPFTQVR